MARVYLAIQTSLERRVALKVMAPALAADSSFSKRFLREARTIASLTHPHIVAVYEVGVTNDHLHYFSMQFLPGGDFAQRMRKGVEQGEIIRVLTGIAKALGFAHQQGVVHRDVTPGNIMFDGADTPLLTDFGIARALSGSTRITSTGVSIGTSNYMSPEQARGGEVDARSDLYSLGALAFEALTGHPPYQGPDGFAVAYAHVFEPIPRLAHDLSHWQAFIDQALAKDPKDRFASADEFIAALQRIPAAAPAAPRQVAAKSAVASASAVPAASVPARSASTAIENLARQVGPATERASGASAPWARIGLIAVLLAGIGATVYGIWLRPRNAEPPAPVAAVTSPPKSVPAKPAPPLTTSTPALATTGEPPVDAAIAVPVDGLPPVDPAADPSTLPADAAVVPAAAAEFVVPTPAERVQTFLDLGQALLKMQRLLLPAEANAALFFSRVLALEPDNESARAGLAAVVDAYLGLADESLDVGRVAEGKERLDRARQVAQTPGLDTPALLARIDDRWNQRVARLREAARAALAAWKGAEAELALNQALTLVPGDVEMKKWLAEAKVIGKPGYRFRDGNGTPEMIIVGAGDVLLGGARRGGELAASVAQPFAAMRREISVAEFRAFVEATRHTVTQEGCRNREGGFFSVSRDRTWREPGFPQSADHPVVCVGYDDAAAYARWMAQTTGQKYRLLSEAEWQLLARQVKVKGCASGNRADQSYRKAEGGNGAQACDDGYAYTAPVGRFEASPPGLYDMEGNVREWVADCANDAHVGRSPGQAARSSGDCSKRMIMGSAWHSDKDESATISRRAESRDWLSNTVGFRLARDLAQPASAQR